MIYTSDKVGIKESVVDELLLLNPHDIPLLSLLKFGNAISNIKHEWLEEKMFADEAKLAADIKDEKETETKVKVDDTEPFSANHVIKIEEEFMLVTGVDHSGKTLDVVRGYAGTDAVSHAGAGTLSVEVMFVEGTEGADARKARKKKRVRKENLTQIFDETIEISGTAMSTVEYGISDPYAHERAKKLIELSHQLEKALINGVGYEKGSVRQMKGLRKFINTNVDISGGALSMDKINFLAQDIYSQGGFKGGTQHILMVPAKQKMSINKLQESGVRLARNESLRGQVVDGIVTDFGVLPVVLNNNLNASELLLIDLNRISIRPLAGREFFHKFLGDKGDYTTGMLVGEYTVEVLQEEAHGRMKGLT